MIWEFSGSEDGVFVEEFVEIAKAEEKESVGIAGFDALVLLHQGRGGVGHFLLVGDRRKINRVGGIGKWRSALSAEGQS